MTTLQQMPAVLPIYLKAATSRRKPEGKPSIPPLSATVDNVTVEPARLAAYNEVCGFANDETLPITYPQVLAASLHMHLMSQPEFPLPMIGLVHVRNHIEQARALRIDESFGVSVRLGESREVPAGQEFDLVTEFSVGEEQVWRALTSILHRVPGPKTKSGKPPVAESRIAQYYSFDAPADTGRRYAKVSGDYNPIHLSALSAKLLGFQRAIAHGMWSLARCAALLSEPLGRAPKALDVQFKQPLFLPGRVAVRYNKAGDGVTFSLLARNSDKLHLTGSMR
jgi:hypothetical protein